MSPYVSKNLSIFFGLEIHNSKLGFVAEKLDEACHSRSLGESPVVAVLAEHSCNFVAGIDLLRNAVKEGHDIGLSNCDSRRWTWHLLVSICLYTYRRHHNINRTSFNRTTRTKGVPRLPI